MVCRTIQGTRIRKRASMMRDGLRGQNVEAVCACHKPNHVAGFHKRGVVGGMECVAVVVVVVMVWMECRIQCKICTPEAPQQQQSATTTE